ncbi:MAG TPA: tetratricopeptide repeat protein [Chthoniobacteraceae bacterium]|jgi:tetratricopeptide (TPR) repeat protein
MNFQPFFKAAPVVFALLAGACVHTPPGTSVEVALAKKPEVVRLPAPPPPVVEPGSAVASTGAGTNSSNGTGVNVPAVEPALPDNKVERVAEAYTRGQFCMQAGKDDEAITAFEEVVRIDPTFFDGWSNLALLYEKTGNEEKAVEAFRKSKKVAGR